MISRPTPTTLPSQLTKAATFDGKTAWKVLLDLTVYLAGPTVRELDFLLDLYEELCPTRPTDHQYLIDELADWWPVHQPRLTSLGRNAARDGAKHPYFEPSRQRIVDARALTAKLWDGRSIEDPTGSWSFTCQRTHERGMGHRAVARILAPIATDPELLHRAARRVADDVEFLSGHAGFTFVYNPWLLQQAFDAIYAHSRRFWGIDVEHLNGTLSLTTPGIKAVSWITLFGHASPYSPEISNAIASLQASPNVQVEHGATGFVVVAGQRPAVGDQNRPDDALAPYFAVANTVMPFFLTTHPDFPGKRFGRRGETTNWLRRFIDPQGWR